MPRPLIPDRANVILDNARDVILEKGYDRATIAEVARRAGVGKGAVYLEFTSKAALLDALLVRSMRSLIADVRARVERYDPPVTLSAAYRFGLEALLADDLMLAFHLADGSVLGGYVREKGHARYGPRMEWLTDYLTDLQHAGLVRGDLEPRAASLLLSVVAAGLIDASSVPGDLTHEQLHDTVDLLTGLINAGWETPARGGDPDAARRAHARLLDHLDSQMEDLP